jgi:cytochrome c oxidase subunit 2
LQCVTCHAGESQAKAPILEELYMKRVPIGFDKGSPTAPGTSVLVDENYLRESIRYPSAKIVAGWQHPSIMPAYDESLVSEDDLFQVIAYIKSLRRGQTPPRIEATTQPRALGAPQGK